MGILSSFIEGRMQKAIQEDPQARQLINKINAVGSHDGSSSSKTIADKYYNYLEHMYGDFSGHIKNLYESILETSSLPIPLVAVYAFAKGAFVDNPVFEPQNLNSEGARKNAMSIKMLFPDYARFINSRHSGTEETVMLCLSSNLLSDVYTALLM